jgi:hypothetical protein
MDYGHHLRRHNWVYADLEIKANSMRIFVVVTLLAVQAYAAADQAKSPAVLSDALLKERWKALAGYHSNTVRYLEIQAELTKSKAAYEKAMADIKAACGTDAVDESGAEVACKAVAK